MLGIGLALALTGCGTSATSSPQDAGPLPTYTLGNALAEDDKNQVEAPEFDQILAKLTAGVGICQPEPDAVAAARTIENTWKASNRSTTLLEWARALVGACG